jgi:hypothetical protein
LNLIAYANILPAILKFDTACPEKSFSDSKKRRWKRMAWPDNPNGKAKIQLARSILYAHIF